MPGKTDIEDGQLANRLRFGRASSGLRLFGNETTVVRGGYGAFYDPQVNQGTTIRQERQWPFDLIYTISPARYFPQTLCLKGF